MAALEDMKKFLLELRGVSLGCSKKAWKKYQTRPQMLALNLVRSLGSPDAEAIYTIVDAAFEAAFAAGFAHGLDKHELGAEHERRIAACEAANVGVSEVKDWMDEVMAAEQQEQTTVN